MSPSFAPIVLGVIAVVVIVAAVVVIVVIARRGRAPSSTPVAQYDGVIESARVVHREMFGDSLNERDPRAIYLNLRFERDGTDVHLQLPGKSARRIRGQIRRRIVGPLGQDRSANVRVDDPREKSRADQMARSGGYTLQLDPEIPVTVFDLGDDRYEWKPVRHG